MKPSIFYLLSLIILFKLELIIFYSKNYLYFTIFDFYHQFWFLLLNFIEVLFIVINYHLFHFIMELSNFNHLFKVLFLSLNSSQFFKIFISIKNSINFKNLIYLVLFQNYLQFIHFNHLILIIIMIFF